MSSSSREWSAVRTASVRNTKDAYFGIFFLSKVNLNREIYAKEVIFKFLVTAYPGVVALVPGVA